jgi:hypothetical protein
VSHPNPVSLTDEERQVQVRFEQAFDADREGMVDAYLREHKNYLNVANARELSPDYARDMESRSRFSRAVYRPACSVIDAAYRRLLENGPRTDQAPRVVFSAGGPGAGKSSVLNDNEIIATAQIIYDSTMTDPEVAAGRPTLFRLRGGHATTPKKS